MEALATYSSVSDEEGGEESPTAVIDPSKTSEVIAKLKEKFPLDSAPHVPIRETQSSFLRLDPKSKEVTYNPTVEQLYAPEVGPKNPFKTKQQMAPKNMLSGYVEPAHFDNFQFENQRRTFHSFGYALNPTADTSEPTCGEFIGEHERAKEMEGLTVFEAKTVRTGKKRRREGTGDPGDVDGYKGPWREYVDQVKVSKPTDEEKAALEIMFADRKKKDKKDEEEKIIEETCMLHVDDPYDYLGRSYLHVPQDAEVDLRTDEPPEACFAPKKLVYSWAGHNKVSAIQLFPKSGHLLLSSGMDGKVKLWEMYGERRCFRTFLGHSKAVRAIDFSHDGTRFLSCSYDRHIKLWDTETGKCISRFTNGKTPYCIRFNPDVDKTNLFVVGCADKKIYTWNVDSGEVVQEYDRHLGSVNTITFVDENRRFVTTSDDKSLRVWEWDIPVDMKYVAEPSMHSMPAVTAHPNGKWLACQAMDNRIMIFGVHNNFRLNRKKSFRGHLVSGYSCVPDFSPDGSFVVSGDADGKLTVWDWKTTRIYTRFKAHDSVCISAQWLPHETSKVVTCGWDGAIKLWD